MRYVINTFVSAVTPHGDGTFDATLEHLFTFGPIDPADVSARMPIRLIVETPPAAHVDATSPSAPSNAPSEDSQSHSPQSSERARA